MHWNRFRQTGQAMCVPNFIGSVGFSLRAFEFVPVSIEKRYTGRRARLQAYIPTRQRLKPY
jgi:hypothetical protein